MKYNIFTFFIVLLICSCKKDNVESILDGKIKTLEWYDPSNALLATYSFYYDSLGILSHVENDTGLYLIFNDPTAVSLKMNYYESILGNPSPTYKKVYFSNNRISSIYTYDTIINTDASINYDLYYNSENDLDSISEAFQPFPAFPSSKAPKNNNYLFVENNCVQFHSVWGGVMPPITGIFTLFADTVNYTFTSLINDGQVPLQCPIRTYKWNSQNYNNTPRGNNLLFMLGLYGFDTKFNKNLIETIKISGSEYYTISFQYTINSKEKVTEMRVTDTQFGSPVTYTFKMNYY